MGIQYPFWFDAFSLPKIVHQRWGSVFGGINFFSQLRFLVMFLDDCQDQIWATQSPELSKVNIDLFYIIRKWLCDFDSVSVLLFRQFWLVIWKSHPYLRSAQNCLLTKRPCVITWHELLQRRRIKEWDTGPRVWSGASSEMNSSISNLNSSAECPWLLVFSFLSQRIFTSTHIYTCLYRDSSWIGLDGLEDFVSTAGII